MDTLDVDRADELSTSSSGDEVSRSPLCDRCFLTALAGWLYKLAVETWLEFAQCGVHCSVSCC